MPREPLLNFDELLAPIKGDTPAGPASAYFELRPQFEELRREVAPDRDSPIQGEVKAANWPNLKRKAEEVLTETTKDLRIAGYLVEALIQMHGFAGAHDGLKFLRLLVEQCWDRMNPPGDAEDPEVRAGPFIWMDDVQRGLLPGKLRMAPLFHGRDDKGYCYFDLRPQEQTDQAKAVRAESEQAAANADGDKVAASLAEVVGSQEELKRLTADLTAKLGPAAPAMTTVSGIFEECRALLDQIQKKRPPSGGNADKEAVDGAPASSQGALAPAATRAEIYRRLEQAALALKALEPHSPIPYLLLRAVELGQMAFPQLMQELVRDSGTLNELKREFGIKNPPSSD